MAAVFTPGAPLCDITDWLETATLDLASRASPAPQESSAVDLFEYQGKQLFARYGIPVSAGAAVDHRRRGGGGGRPRRLPGGGEGAGAGGRARQGGRHQARAPTPTRSARHAGNILGMDIKGHVVKVVWIEQASDIAEEYYASFTLDRAAKLHLGMLSAQGGVEIEQVAEENPDAIAHDPRRSGRRAHRGAVPRVGRRRRSSTPRPPTARSTSCSSSTTPTSTATPTSSRSTR